MRKPTDRFGHDLRTVLPLESTQQHAANDPWAGAIKRREERRHRIDWIVVIAVWLMTGTAIFGQLTGTIRFGITIALLFASTGLIIAITPSIFSRR